MEARSCSNRSQPLWEPGDNGTYPTAPAWLSAKWTCTPDRQWRDGALQRGLPEGISAHLPGSSLCREKGQRTTGTLRIKGNCGQRTVGFSQRPPFSRSSRKMIFHTIVSQQGPCLLQRDTPHSGTWTGSPACCGERVSSGLAADEGGGCMAEVSKLEGWRESAGRQEAQVLEGTSDPWWRAS